MPCHSCGARQDDPAGGPSPWKRGVIASEQVLICPSCQRGDWTAALDRCPACDGVRLSKTLGVVRCSACGWTGEAQPSPPPGTEVHGLQADVAAALDRVLRKAPDSAADR